MPEQSIYEDIRAETYPADYPSGWYHLFDVDELRPGKVMRIDALGKHLVAFRGKDSGAIHVLDAHCPHQGAHLAAGGRVEGDCIRCPFHNWGFDGEGRLADIPGLEKLPRARINSYPVREHYKMLWMYHDVSGQRVEAPYEPELHPDVDAGGLVYRGRYAPRDVRMHISEFIENSVDFQHFAVLHNEVTIPWTRVKIPGMGIQHDAGWELDEARPHVAYFTDYAYLTVGKKHLHKSGAHAKITLFGPGSTVWFRFTLPDLGDVLMFQTHLPTGPLNQRVRFHWWADRKVPRALAWYVVGHWISQWKADIEVWENKIMRDRPVLVRLDGPVHKMRRWVRQFYTPSQVGEARGQRVAALDRRAEAPAVAVAKDAV